jgi:ATPase subunit of ABC transporter with duplicated ATPase domains
VIHLATRHPHANTFHTLSASNLTKRFGGMLVLSRVSLIVAPGDRIGVVGPNGAGKSTLLKILAGVEEADEGRVVRSPASMTAGYLPQEPDVGPGETLLQYLARRSGVQDAERRMDAAAAAMAGVASPPPARIQAYTEALERFVALGGGDFEPRAAEAAARTGLRREALGLPVGVFSGGEGARVSLAALMLSRFDVLLADEPTNNLDFAGLDLLEEVIEGHPGGVVMVSHDRAFLSRTVRRVVEIDEHSRRTTEYPGGWEQYLREREDARRRAWEAYERYQEERARLLALARTKRTDAASGATRAKRRPKDPDKTLRNLKKEGAENLGAKAAQIDRRLDRLEKVEKPRESWQLRLTLAPGRRGGDVVARLEAAVVERGTFRLGPVDLEVGWGERVAVLGPNGSGKSTLLGAILGAAPLAAGRRWIGPGIVMGTMDQARELYSGPEPLVDRFSREAGLLQEEARTLLAKFGLGAHDVLRPCESLSPGERTRAVLAHLMAAGVNCLVLDEPTNHLDLPAIEQLQEALDTSTGTLLLVTHDRDFLEHLRVTRTVRLDGGHVVEG